MKTLIWSLAATFACAWGANSLVLATDAENVKIMKCISQGEDGQPVVVVKTLRVVGEGDSPADHEVKIEIITGADVDSDLILLHKAFGDVAEVGSFGMPLLERISLLGPTEDIDSDAGWLGVQLGLVSRSTSNESDDSDDVEGFTIINIAVGSPAAEAGFEKDDVVIEIDDVVAGADLSSFVNLVRDAEPGDRMKFTVLRDGERLTLVATLGSRADTAGAKWIHEGGNMVLFHDAVHSKAKILRRGDGGTWKFQFLDGGADCTALPDDISKLIHRIHSRTVRVIEDDGEKNISIAIVRDGESIAINTTDDGGIEVRRTDPETDEETVTVYADLEELGASDEDAFEIYSKAGSHIFVQLDLQGIDDHDFDFELDFGDDSDFTFNWVDDLESRLADHSNDLAEFMERLKDIHIEFKDSDSLVEGGSENTFFAFLHGKAQQTIRENPDGTIDVVVRKGANELVTRYADVDDLQDRNPDAYETYSDLKGTVE